MLADSCQRENKEGSKMIGTKRDKQRRSCRIRKKVIKMQSASSKKDKSRNLLTANMWQKGEEQWVKGGWGSSWVRINSDLPGNEIPPMKMWCVKRFWNIEEDAQLILKLMLWLLLNRVKGNPLRINFRIWDHKSWGMLMKKWWEGRLWISTTTDDWWWREWMNEWIDVNELSFRWLYEWSPELLWSVLIWYELNWNELNWTYSVSDHREQSWRVEENKSEEK